MKIVAGKLVGNGATDMEGWRFGRLVALSISPQRMNGKLAWECLCDCGETKKVRSSHLKDGLVRSCGCLYEDFVPANKTHDRSEEPLYRVWASMNARCSNPNAGSWKNYGGRGITVCKRWRGPGGFVLFAKDMGERPPGFLIERKNNSLGYSPSNCVWASQTQQGRNKRNNRFVVYLGKKKLLKEWAEELGLSYKEMHRRIVSRGWPVEKAFTTPVKK